MSTFVDGETDITDQSDIRRLAYLNPNSVSDLLRNGTLVDHADYYPLCADLLCLTRSMSSKIPMDWDGERFYDCSKHLKPVFVNTVNVEFRSNEKPEQHFLHRDASVRFINACKASQDSGGDDRGVWPVAEMRELQLTTASTKLRVFNTLCNEIRLDTLTESLSRFRENGFDGWGFVKFLCEAAGCAVPATAIEYIRFITTGSPMIRAVINEICTKEKYLKPRKNGKLLIMEDTPLIAMYIQWCLNMMGINTALFHSGLSISERNELQARFNDPSSEIDVMVTLYDVGGIGRNFHVDCCHGMLTSAAKNQAAEIQAYGRLVRVRYQNLVFDNFVLTFLLGSSEEHCHSNQSNGKKLHIRISRIQKTGQSDCRVSNSISRSSNSTSNSPELE